MNPEPDFETAGEGLGPLPVGSTYLRGEALHLQRRADCGIVSRAGRLHVTRPARRPIDSSKSISVGAGQRAGHVYVRKSVKRRSSPRF